MKRVRRANATVWTAILALALLPAAVRAQEVALAVGNTVPVVDVFGRNWLGTNNDPGNSCPVEIRRTWTDGVILAPSNDPAQLEALNPLVTNTYLGRGVVGANPGIYAETFTNRSVLATNQQYYARVFDRPPGPAPVYYADTLPFFPPATDPSVNPEFGPQKLVATGEPDVDTDGDGIPDAMENERTGTIASEWDSDRDGWDDRFEVLNDTLDPNESRPIDVWIHPPQVAEDPTTVSWWALPGVAYRLEFHPDQVDATNYVEVAAGAASSTEKVEEVDWVLDESPTGFFRVKAFPYGMP